MIVIFTPTWQMLRCEEQFFQMGWFNHQLVGVPLEGPMHSGNLRLTGKVGS